MDKFQEMAWRNAISESMHSSTRKEEELEQQPNIIEKRNLDDSTQAWLMDNGRIVISSEHGIELVLSPKRAWNLLDFLYDHRDQLYQLVKHGGQEEQP